MEESEKGVSGAVLRSLVAVGGVGWLWSFGFLVGEEVDVAAIFTFCETRE